MTQQTQFLMKKGSDTININSENLATYLTAGYVPVSIRYSGGGEESDLISQVLMIKGTDAIRVLPDSVLTYENLGYVVYEILYGANALKIPSIVVDETNTLPYVISARLLLNLEANKLVLSDNAAVATWADQSGNSHDFTQSNGANKPIFHSSVAGYPAVTFDGVN